MRLVLSIALAAAAITCVQMAQASDDPADYPHQVLRNDTGMRVTVMLADPDKGFYRGTRFDRSGHIAQAKYRGHTFFGLWRLRTIRRTSSTAWGRRTSLVSKTRRGTNRPSQAKCF